MNRAFMDNECIAEIQDLLTRLKASIKNYDTEKDGYIFAKDLSNHISLFCHDTSATYSISKQFSLQDKILFLSSSSDSIEVNGIYTSSLMLKFYNKEGVDVRSYSNCSFQGKGIFNFLFEASVCLVSVFRDSSFTRISKFITFDEWWNQEKMVRYSDNQYSRQQIVQLIRNKDSGAHKEKNKNDKALIELKSLNSLLNYKDKWAFTSNGKMFEMKYSGIYEVVRSIASELVISLEKYIEC